MFSTARLGSGCKVESVQLKLERNWFRELVFSNEFHFSNCSSSRNSLRIRVLMGCVPFHCLDFVVLGTSRSR